MKRVFAIVLAMALVLSTMPVFAAEYSINKQTVGKANNPLVVSEGSDGVQYLSLGDSIAYGYTLDGEKYSLSYPVLDLKEGCYPQLIKDYLGCGDDDFVQGAVCGARLEDICTILDSVNYPGDAYFEGHVALGKNSFIDGATDGNRITQEYLSKVKSAAEKADLITISAGGNDLLTSLMVTMKNPSLKGDLKKYFSGTAVASFNVTKSLMLAQAKALDKLSKKTASDDTYEAKVEKVFNILEIVLYEMASYVNGASDVLDAVHSINRNAVIAITGVPDVLADFDIRVGKIVIDLDKIMSPMYSAVNSVIKNAAEERSAYVRYVDITDIAVAETDADYLEGMVIPYDNLSEFFTKNIVALSHPQKEGHGQIANEIMKNFKVSKIGDKVSTFRNIIGNIWSTIMSRIGITKVQNFVDIFKQINLWGVVKLSLFK